MADQIPNDALEMLPEFLQESEEHLQILNEKMLEAENAIKNGIVMSQEDLNTMFRSAHTIKGTASFLELKKVVGLTHKAETLLQRLRDGELVLTAPIVDVLFATFDKLNSLLESLKETRTEGVDIDAEVRMIEAILSPGGASPAPSAVPLAALKARPSEPAKDKPKADEPVSEEHFQQFILDCRKNVDELRNLFEGAGTVVADQEVINNIFRIMHTIKGSADSVKVKPIAEVAHKMESVLSYFRTQKKPLSEEIVAVLLKGVDALKVMVEALGASSAIDYDIRPVCRELDRVSIKVVLEMKVAAQAAGVLKKAIKVQEVSVDWGDLSASQRSLVKAGIDNGNDIFLIEGVIAAQETIKSVRLAMVNDRLGKNGYVVAAFPSDDVLNASQVDTMCTLLFCSQLNENNIREVLAMDNLTISTVEKADHEFVQTLLGAAVVAGGADAREELSVPAQVVAQETVGAKEGAGKFIEAKGAAGAPVEISTVKIDSRKIDKLMNLSGELVIIRSQYARLAGIFSNDLIKRKEMIHLAEHSSVLMADLDRMMMPALSSFKESSRIKKFLGEVKAVLQNLSLQLNNESMVENINALSETTNVLEKMITDLQASVMQTRMVPVEGVFTRFKRVVRDISKDLNKEVDLQIEGAETELDKKIVDGLSDPLTHMIRNAVDHGLEDPDTREKLGKARQGTIILKASHKGSSMCIQISDDGRGMDPAKIAAAAVKKSVITEDQASRMTDKEKLNLIFLPGFSMAQKVTGLSGRGVGMDVVRSMISSFNGFVDIDTQVGKGTTFVLRIPLTLAIIQALLVVIGENVYAFSLEAVTEIIKVSDKDIYSVNGNATVKLRDHALSLVELEKVIRTGPNAPSGEALRHVVIITDGDNRLGVLVDSILGKDEIVIKSFTKHFSKVKGIIGASILADGNVALILDSMAIIKESRQ